MTDADVGAQTIRRLPTRTRSNFAARTARDESRRLHRRSFAQHSPPANEGTPLLQGQTRRPPVATSLYEGADGDAQEADPPPGSVGTWLGWMFRSRPLPKSKLSGQHGKRRSVSEASRPRPGALPRPVGGNGKLGTFAGVFVPVTLNVLSILMFLRFGFILGQAGFVGMMGMLIAGYLINLLTTMSVCSCTNCM
jgi:potassium/chloride transporter 9